MAAHTDERSKEELVREWVEKLERIPEKMFEEWAEHYGIAEDNAYWEVTCTDEAPNSLYPNCMYMYSFSNKMDDHRLPGLRLEMMSEHGWRVYQTKYGYFFGRDVPEKTKEWEHLYDIFHY